MDRYLRYDAPTVLAGLDHHVANLRCLLREAHATERLALLPPLTLHPKHNFGHNRDWQWSDYYDLDASTLLDRAGQERPLPVVGRLPAESCGHQVVTRRLTDPVFKNQVPKECRPCVSVRLRPAAAVRRLAEQALEGLRPVGDGGFVGVHVRRGDRLGEYPAALTEPPHIEKRLQRMSVPRGATLYLASDEREPGFFAPLREHYRVVRYSDFPFLKALVAGERPDNYLLYRVEQELLGHARLWIETLPNRGSHAHAALVEASQWRRSSPGLWETGRRSLRRLHAWLPPRR